MDSGEKAGLVRVEAVDNPFVFIVLARKPLLPSPSELRGLCFGCVVENDRLSENIHLLSRLSMNVLV